MFTADAGGPHAKDIVAMLLSAGANPHFINRNQMTAIDVAERRGQMVRVLV